MRYHDFTFECKYYVTEAPSKHSKPRPVLHTEEITVPVWVVTPAEARVACIYSEDEQISQANEQKLLTGPKTSFRCCKSGFYQRLRDDVPSEVDFLEKYLRDIISVPRTSYQAAIKDAQRWARQFIIVDDGGVRQVWGKTPEPCWVVDVEKDTVVVRFTAQWQRYRVKFGATEFSRAAQFAKMLAKMRGCSCILPKSQKEFSTHFSILNPKVFHQTFEKEFSANSDGFSIKVLDITESASVALIDFVSHVGGSEYKTFTRVLVKDRKLLVSLKCFDSVSVKKEFLALLQKECGVDVACFWLLLNQLYPSLYESMMKKL